MIDNSKKMMCLYAILVCLLCKSSFHTVDICKKVIEPALKFALVACDGLFEQMTDQEVVDFVSEGLSKGVCLCCNFVLLDSC